MGIYYNVDKHYPEYHLKSLRPWWKVWHSSNEDFYFRANDKVHLFFKVFSPGEFTENVYIEWYWYNDREGEWQRSDRIPLKITGGREEGFRGITKKANYKAGEWRIIVKTSNNLILGELDFDLIQDNSNDPRKFKITIDK